LIPFIVEGRRLYRIDRQEGSELGSLQKAPQKCELESVSRGKKDLKYILF